MNSEQFIKAITEILESKKAADIECIPVADKTTLAEYFIVASGNTVTQVKALEDELTYKLKEQYGILPEGVEGRDSGRWILLDYGSIIVHIFHKADREFYSLDTYWKKKTGHDEVVEES